MTHYEILGVSPDALHSEIKQHYRRLVKQYHPDLNPSEEAKELIRRITGAYEVLSDPVKRQRYDWSLNSTAVPQPEPESEVDENTRYRWEYIRKKREQEERNWQQLFRMKVRFYKCQRYFAFFFLLTSLVYSYDYFVLPVEGQYTIYRIGINRFGETGIAFDGKSFSAGRKLYEEVKSTGAQRVNLHHSALLDIPVGVSLLENGKYFRFHRTLHSYANFFSYLLMGLSLVLIVNRTYSDWSLTIGILPFFVTAFLFLFTYITLAG